MHAVIYNYRGTKYEVVCSTMNQAMLLAMDSIIKACENDEIAFKWKNSILPCIICKDYPRALFLHNEHNIKGTSINIKSLTESAIMDEDTIIHNAQKVLDSE